MILQVSLGLNVHPSILLLLSLVLSLPSHFSPVSSILALSGEP